MTTDVSLDVAGSIKTVVFDCDGVILESMHCKAKAFRRLFADWPDHVDAIEAFHYANGGLSRYDKIERIYRDILHQRLDDETRDQLADTFGQHVLEEILTCDLVHGAMDTLEALDGRLPLYVASATPEKELCDVLERRNLARYFKRIFGHPTSKAEALRLVKQAEGIRTDELLFIGDAQADVEAAEQAGCQFVGRRTPGGENPFAGRSVPLVADCTPLIAWLVGSDDDLTRKRND